MVTDAGLDLDLDLGFGFGFGLAVAVAVSLAQHRAAAGAAGQAMTRSYPPERTAAAVSPTPRSASRFTTPIASPLQVQARRSEGRKG